jgi:protocatechuate 4,5-dioxygenase alpha chain
MSDDVADYDRIAGTKVFDARRSRQGYKLNMFCMSLMKAENRAAFKADEAAYVKTWKMTPEQERAILERDWNAMLHLGGNIYFTSKLGATDGLSFRQLAALMTSMPEEEYAAMMLQGGRQPGSAVNEYEYPLLPSPATGDGTVTEAEPHETSAHRG